MNIKSLKSRNLALTLLFLALITAALSNTGDWQTKALAQGQEEASSDDLAGVVVTVSYTGPAVAVPDSNAAGINIVLPVAGVGTVTDLNFRFDTGGACDASIGNTNAAMNHTFIGDLIFKLTSPSGLTRSFMARRAGTRENICLTNLNDNSFFPSLSGISNQTGFPVAGDFSPDQPFTAFNGQNGDGNWIINVSDNAGADTGSIRRFSLIFNGDATVQETSTDFDGDGRSDESIFRPSVGEWYYSSSSVAGSSPGAQFGAFTDRIAPADYTGDGRADFAFFRPSDASWYILRSENQTFFAFPYGANGDIPAPGDFDGDGKADAAIFRPLNGIWAARRSSDGGSTIQQFGANGDIPVVGDYDGDSKADFAIYRPSTREWYVIRSSNGTVFGAPFGALNDRPVPGDYSGDGRTDFAVFRPSNGFWYVLNSANQNLFLALPFGLNTDTPTIGDYDGDGRNDLAVFRPLTGVWYVRTSNNGGVTSTQFGISTDRPSPAYYLP